MKPYGPFDSAAAPSMTYIFRLQKYVSWGDGLGASARAWRKRKYSRISACKQRRKAGNDLRRPYGC